MSMVNQEWQELPFMLFCCDTSLVQYLPKANEKENLQIVKKSSTLPAISGKMTTSSDIRLDLHTLFPEQR